MHLAGLLAIYKYFDVRECVNHEVVTMINVDYNDTASTFCCTINVLTLRRASLAKLKRQSFFKILHVASVCKHVKQNLHTKR